jgi:hypothetical protein
MNNEPNHVHIKDTFGWTTNSVQKALPLSYNNDDIHLIQSLHS